MLFDYDYFLYAVELCLAIPLGNLIIVYSLGSYFLNLSYSFFSLWFAEEAIDILLTVKDKLIKEEKRQLDCVLQEK